MSPQRTVMFVSLAIISVVGANFLSNVRASEFESRARPPVLPSAQQRSEIRVSRELGSATGLAWQPVGKAPGRGTLWVAYQEVEGPAATPA